MANKDNIKRILPILEAYDRGEGLEYQCTENGDWVDVDYLAVHNLVNHPEMYRIKPKTEYRPFNSAKECFEEMQKHSNGTWFKANDASCYFQVVRVTDLGIKDGNDDFTSFVNAAHRYYFLDGSKFGIKIED